MDQKNNIPSLADCLSAADETRAILIKKDCLRHIPANLNEYFTYNSVYLVADGSTWEAAGKAVEQVMEDHRIRIAGKYIFPAEPRLHAEYHHIRSLADELGQLPNLRETVPIAIGGGTINDIVKRAAFEHETPYLCIPTAASVDGFTAFGASILMDGFKQTLPCTAPRAVAADSDILAAAPAYLSSSGFGDLASKIVAGSDWIITDLAAKAGAAGTNAIDEKAWAMTQPGLRGCLDRAVTAAAGDAEAVKALFEALAITGLSMQYFKTSRPVSGSEHLFSHVWEMEDLSVNGVPVTHGHKVTIGTLTAAAFTELFFADAKGPPPAAAGFRLPNPSERMVTVSTAFKGSLAHDGVVKEALEKLPDAPQAERERQIFADNWKDIRGKVLAQLMPYAELKKLLGEAGCPIVPAGIGLRRDYVIATARRAQMIRNKYTILDLAFAMGNLETVLKRMEESDVYLR